MNHDYIARRTAQRLIGLNFPLMESAKFVSSLGVLIQDEMSSVPELINAMGTLHNELEELLQNCCGRVKQASHG